MATHLHLDPFSGISGDMFLGMMLELGLTLDQLRDAFAKVPAALPYSLSVDSVLRAGVAASHFHVHWQHAPEHENEHQHKDEHEHQHEHEHAHTHMHHDDHAHAHVHEHAPEQTPLHEHQHAHTHEHTHAKPAHHHHGPHVHYHDMLHLIDHLQASDRSKQRARKMVDELAQAEARVHRMPIEKVHFHEVGAIDSMVDMLGAAIAIDLLHIDRITCGPLPLSRGYVKCDHGLMPVPAPATLYLLEGLPTYGVERSGELITPTGAAIVRALVDAFTPPPMMRLYKIGYGAGSRNDPQVPNVLRGFLGQT